MLEVEGEGVSHPEELRVAGAHTSQVIMDAQGVVCGFLQPQAWVQVQRSQRWI